MSHIPMDRHTKTRESPTFLGQRELPISYEIPTKTPQVPGWGFILTGAYTKRKGICFCIWIRFMPFSIHEFIAQRSRLTSVLTDSTVYVSASHQLLPLNKLSLPPLLYLHATFAQLCNSSRISVEWFSIECRK